MEDLDVDLFKLLVTVGFLFLIWTKSLWEDLQHSSAAFYPDGLNKCPPHTYSIDDNRNRVRCIACPKCPTGKEPSPPCGSTLVRMAAGECVTCKAGTYSDGADSATCKLCTDCGSKEILSSCTAITNAKCWECPQKQYEDETTHTCKPCSLCCEENSTAQKDCFTSRKCTGNCSQTTQIKEKYHYSSKLKKLVRTMRSPFNNRGQRVSQDINKRLESRVKTNLEEPTFSERPKRDIHQEDYKDTTYSDTKDVSNSAPDKDIDGKELEDFQSLQSPTKVPKDRQEKIDTTSPDIRDTSNIVKQEQQQPVEPTFNPLIPPTGPDSNIGQFVLPRPENQKGMKTFNNTAVKSKRRVVLLLPSVTPSTAQDSRMMPPPTPVETVLTSRVLIEQFVAPSTASFLSSFSGTITALCVFGLIGIIIYLVRKGCVRNKQKGYRKMSEKEDSNEQQIGDDQFDGEPNGDERVSLTAEVIVEHLDQNEAIQIVDDLNLSEIPPDLEDILVKRLDVPLGKSDSNEYGWIKVGNAAGISRHDLKFYQTEYLRPNGSPTKLLLEKLGSQGKTISYLIDVLQAPVVQLDNVAASIRHRITRV